MAIVLLSVDLLAAAQLDGAARKWSVPMKSVANAEQALAYCADPETSALFIDLSTTSLDVQTLVGQLKGQTARTTTPAIIAYGPHVHGRLLAAAREAGCDRVLSRGQFLAELSGLVAEFGRANP